MRCGRNTRTDGSRGGLIGDSKGDETSSKPSSVLGQTFHLPLAHDDRGCW